MQNLSTQRVTTTGIFLMLICRRTREAFPEKRS